MAHRKHTLLKLPLSNERLNQAMLDRGMIPLDQMHRPMAFALHAGVHTLDDFRQWGRMKCREYTDMASREGRYEDDPEMHSWVMGKAAVYGALGRALDAEMPPERMRHWVNRFSDAVSKTRIRLQMEDFEMSSPRAQRIFALDGAWSEIRQELDYVMNPDPEKSVMPGMEEAMAGPDM